MFPTLLIFFISSAQTPISLTTSDMPVIGGVYQVITDTMPAGFTIGNAGQNRTWNYANLNGHILDTLYFVAPASTPYAASYPNANLAMTADFNGYIFYRNNTQSFRVEGFAGNDPILGQTRVNLNPPTDQYRFSIDYLDNFSGSYSWRVTKGYNQLPPSIQQQIQQNLPQGASVDSARITYTASYTDTIDAWGKVITPLGAYECLRRKRVENGSTLAELKIRFIPVGPYSWQTVPGYPVASTATEHSWLTAVTKLPVITLGYDNQRNITSVTYSAIPPPPVAGFTWSNPSDGLVNFTNTSQNSPAAFHWDFGNGDTSSLQNPSHNYSFNGSYYVCLTATNQSGSHTFCDTVHVTGIGMNRPPEAARDSAYTVYPNAAVIDALANDSDPDGDSIFYVIWANPANGIATYLPSGEFEYHANAAFRGIDSFLYVIRDNGTPYLQDTAWVVIRVDGVPFANFTYSVSGRTVTFVDLSAGAATLSWNLGDGSAATTATVIHTYTTAGIYNVCLTATNSFGADDTCRTVDLTVGLPRIQNNVISLFPNPASEAVKAKVGNRNVEKAEVMDLNGRICITQFPFKHADEIFLDVSSLPQGFYFCRLTFTDGKAISGKLLKY